MLFCFYPCVLFFGYWAVLGEMEEVGMWGLPLCCCSIWLIAARRVKAWWSGWWGGCSTRPFNPTHRYAFPPPTKFLILNIKLKGTDLKLLAPTPPSLDFPLLTPTQERRMNLALRKKPKNPPPSSHGCLGLHRASCLSVTPRQRSGMSEGNLSAAAREPRMPQLQDGDWGANQNNLRAWERTVGAAPLFISPSIIGHTAFVQPSKIDS